MTKEEIDSKIVDKKAIAFDLNESMNNLQVKLNQVMHEIHRLQIEKRQKESKELEEKQDKMI